MVARVSQITHTNLWGDVGAHAVPVRQQFDVELAQFQITVTTAEPHRTQHILRFSSGDEDVVMILGRGYDVRVRLGLI